MIWVKTSDTAYHCDIGDQRLQLYYIRLAGEEPSWEACCGNYMDYAVLMADNIEDAKQEALNDLLNIVADSVVKEAMFLQSIIGTGL